MARYRVLNPDNEDDNELILKYGNFINTRLENESVNAFRAWIRYSTEAGFPNHEEKELEDVLKEVLKTYPIPRKSKHTFKTRLAEWEKWSEQYGWEDRLLVAYYQAITSVLV